MSETGALLYNLLTTTAGFGPITAARMMAAATLGLPYGLAYAGGQGVIQGVEAGM